MGAATGVDTARAEHRALRFDSLDELQAEIDRIVAADQGGRLRRTGNWTVGQTFGHLATWINYGWEGYPFKVPWFIKLILHCKCSISCFLNAHYAASCRVETCRRRSAMVMTRSPWLVSR